jgi:S1-C subfamily serine protease
MSFPLQYKNLKPAVVAIVARISRRPDFPDIIGTGFIADADGVIVTNDHVIKAVKQLPKRKGAPDNEWPIRVMLLRDLPGQGMGVIYLDVEGIGSLGREKPIEGYHYGSDLPDIGVIYVKARGLPFLEVEPDFSLDEGDEVFISGFPMGTTTLRAPGWIHQINPVLQRGIVSAIQPFPCEKPHGLLIEAMVQGGSSGSPIFNPKTGKVAALLYGGIIDQQAIQLPNGAMLPYRNNTSLTMAVPAYLVSDILKLAANPSDKSTGEVVSRDPRKHPTLDEMMKTYPMLVNEPKKDSPGTEPISASDIELPR